MKRLTIDQTWEQCLAMWKWIIEQLDADPDQQIDDLKSLWLQDNGYEDDSISEDCFLCNEAYRLLPEITSDRKPCLSSDTSYCCPYCPARDIEGDFYCMKAAHHYDKKPRLFYAELKRLNKIRLANK